MGERLLHRLAWIVAALVLLLLDLLLALGLLTAPALVQQLSQLLAFPAQLLMVEMILVVDPETQAERLLGAG